VQDLLAGTGDIHSRFRRRAISEQFPKALRLVDQAEVRSAKPEKQAAPTI
jgi:hypothetical protein